VPAPSPFDELRRRLRRLDLLLLRAVRRMRLRPQSTARGEHWGALITDDDVDDLLREAGELPARSLPGESERRLAQAVDNAAALRDAPGPMMDALRSRHGLEGVDVDILLLALAPDVSEGYGRILAFLNDYAVMPWATVDLAARVLETRRPGRIAVLERFLPESPLIRGGLLTLHPLDPHVQPYAWRRVQVARELAAELLGLDEEPENTLPINLALVTEGDDETSFSAERIEDSPSVERRSLFRDLVRKWRNFVSGPSAEPSSELGRVEPSRPDLESPRPEAARSEPPTRPPLRVVQPGLFPGAARDGLSPDDRLELADRLKRADLLLLHAVRLHREQPWVSEAARGKDLMNLSLITEREVQDLLLQRGDPYLRGPSGVEALLDAAQELRDTPGGRLAELRERCGLNAVDMDILLIALLPELASGYKRIFHFLNSFLHDHLTVGLLTRLIGADPQARHEVRLRLTTRGPLLGWDLVALQPVFPTQDHFPALRVSLREPLVHYLLGMGPPPGRTPGQVIGLEGGRAK